MRRLATIALGQQAIEGLLGLPEGLQVLAVRENRTTWLWEVLVTGDSLREVPDNAEPPSLNGWWATKHLVAGGERYIRAEWTTGGGSNQPDPAGYEPGDL